MNWRPIFVATILIAMNIALVLFEHRRSHHAGHVAIPADLDETSELAQPLTPKLHVVIQSPAPARSETIKMSTDAAAAAAQVAARIANGN
jgi:hypothetical protein